MNIFELPEIVIPKVSLEDILTLVRKNTNKHYMPTGTGTTHHSKPEYVKSELLNYPGWPAHYDHAVGFDHYAGYAELTDSDGWTKRNAPIFLYLWISGFTIVINLETEEALITRAVKGNHNYDNFVKWDKPEQKIPLMPSILEELIENHYVSGRTN